MVRSRVFPWHYTILAQYRYRLWHNIDLVYIPKIIYNENTQPEIRAIGVSHTACKDEFRRNLRSHSWCIFIFIIYIWSYYTCLVEDDLLGCSGVSTSLAAAPKSKFTGPSSLLQSPAFFLAALEEECLLFMEEMPRQDAPFVASPSLCCQLLLLAVTADAVEAAAGCCCRCCSCSCCCCCCCCCC